MTGSRPAPYNEALLRDCVRWIVSVKTTLLLTTCFLALGCDSAGDARRPGPDRESGQEPAASASGIVEVTAVDYAFIAPDSIASGWTTFRMKNVGQEHHLLLLYRLPEDRTFDEYLQMTPPFERVMDAVEEGGVSREEAVERLMALLPDWASETTPMGGPGLVAAGRMGETTVHLTAGSYVMECYVRTSDGRLHSSLGMVRPLTVTSEPSGATPPGADLELTLSDAAFSTDQQPEPGTLTVAVRFGGLPMDVHLARITGATDTSRLSRWIDLLTPGGLREPAPADFLGGAGGMPPGNTAYFTVEFEPGRYAWVSGPANNRTMVREFVVR